MIESASRKSLYKKLAINSLSYGSGMIVIKLLGFVLLPFYFKGLSPEEFGIIAVTDIVVLMLAPLFSLGTSDALLRFYHSWSSSEQKQQVTGLFLVTITGSFILNVLLTLSFSNVWNRHFPQVDFYTYIMPVLWMAFCLNINLFYTALLRTSERLLEYNIIAIGTFLTQTTFSFLLIFKYEMGVRGYILGFLASSVLWSTYMMFSLIIKSDFNISWKSLKPNFQYSAPLIFSGLLEGLSNSIDKFILQRLMPLNDLGHYSLANQIGGGYNFINQFMKTAYIPFVYRVYESREDRQIILSQISYMYILLLSFPALVISVYSRDLFYLIDNFKFIQVSQYIPLSIFYFFIFTLATALGRGLEFAKKNIFSIYIQLFWLLLLVTCLPIFIPIFGIFGAYLAVIVALFFRFLLQVYLSQKFAFFEIFWKKIISLIIVNIGVYFVCIQIKNFGQPFGLFLRTIIVFIYAAVLSKFFIDQNSKALILQFINFKKT